MAYSSIGHIGYALIGLAVGTAEGVRGVLVYMAIYVFMNVGTFAVILCMRHNGRMVEEIADLAGLSDPPDAGLAMLIFMFSWRASRRSPASSASSTSSSRRSRQLYSLAIRATGRKRSISTAGSPNVRSAKAAIRSNPSRLRGVVGDAHPHPAAAGRGLDHHRETDALGGAGHIGGVGDRFPGARARPEPRRPASGCGR